MFFYRALQELQDRPRGTVKVRRHCAPVGTYIMRIFVKEFDDVLAVVDPTGEIIEIYTPTQSDLWAFDWDLV
mgnify:CR=1 FL=1